jgi:hypothetical protein
VSELHDRLSALAADARWPATPDLAPRVRAAIADGAAPRRGRLRLALARQPAALLAGTLLALVVAGLLAATPGVRSALLRSLGLEHAQVTRVERLPPTTLGARLALGERYTLAAAQKRAGFALRRPAALDAPDEVFVDRGAVTFVYGERSGRVILLQQVPGSGRPYIQKFAKAFGRVHVAGVPGLLVKGQHVTIFDQRPGGRREERSRLAKTTLLWERDGLLLRLEADLSDNELLRIARSVR